MDQGKDAKTAPQAIDPVYAPRALENPVMNMKTPSMAAITQISVGFEGKVDPKAKTAAIILAGGSGERFGREGGKQMVEIAGRPILTWSAESFDAVPDVGQIVIVCPEDRMQEYKERAIDPFPFVTPVVFAPAGDLRQESAFSGLEYVSENFEFVMLHDGARPLISPDLISYALNVLKGSIDADGVVVGHPSVDTLKIVEDGVIVGTPDRKVFWNAQTPQAFRTGIYRRAHESALSDGFVGTDDSSLIERLGGRVMMVEGKRDNIKLTVPEDYEMLAAAVVAQAIHLEESHRFTEEDGAEDGSR